MFYENGVRWALCLAAFTSASLAGSPSLASESEALAVCEISRSGPEPVKEDLQPAREDRECSFSLRLSANGKVYDRTYSCTVPRGQTRCEVKVPLAREGAVAVIQSVWTSPYLDATDNSAGCSYVSGSPSASLSSSREISVTHRYACAKLLSKEGGSVRAPAGR